MDSVRSGKESRIKQATISNFETRPDKATLSTMFKIIQALDLTVKVETRSESKTMCNAFVLHTILERPPIES
jgi:hypothetical protein